MTHELIDEGVVDQLEALGYDRNECIKASQLATNYKDINEVQEKVIEIQNEQTQKEYDIDQEQKQLEVFKEWKCETCSRTNILYKSICDECKKECKNGTIELNAKNIIQTLLQTWSNVDKDDIKLEKVSDALSSKLYIVTNAIDKSKIIFRIYNPNTINDNHHEIQHLFANKLEIGPKLISKFSFGQIEEFLDSRQSERIKDLYQNEEIAKTVAKYIAKIHSSTLRNPRKSNITDGWIKYLLDHASNALKNKDNHERFKWFTDIIKDNYAKDDDCKDVNIYDFIDIERKYLNELIEKNSHDLCYRSLKDVIDTDEKEKKFANTTDTVFCHNDLNHRNILIMNKNNDNDDDKKDGDKNGVRIIDYEYSGYCNRFWDFGHYFCEIGINASLPPPKYFAINIDKEYPDLKYRKMFVRSYLNELLRIKLNVKKLGDVAIIDDKYIDLMVNVIEIGTLYIHFIGVCWAFGEWQNSKGKEVGFDFKRYTKERMQCYFQQKKVNV